MVNDALRFALRDRHVHRVDDKLRLEIMPHCPADDPSREGIEHDGQVDEARPGRDVCNVRHPELVRLVGPEVAVAQVVDWDAHSTTLEDIRRRVFIEEQGVAAMAAEDIVIRVLLGRGDAAATVWTSDLSYDYVKINAEYRT